MKAKKFNPDIKLKKMHIREYQLTLTIAIKIFTRLFRNSFVKCLLKAFPDRKKKLKKLAECPNEYLNSDYLLNMLRIILAEKGIVLERDFA